MDFADSVAESYVDAILGEGCYKTSFPWAVFLTDLFCSAVAVGFIVGVMMMLQLGGLWYLAPGVVGGFLFAASLSDATDILDRRIRDRRQKVRECLSTIFRHIYEIEDKLGECCDARRKKK